MKTVLLIGAGKSASVLIDYLVQEANANKWRLIIADADREQILAKISDAGAAEIVALDVANEDARGKLIAQAHVVISLMPPALHYLIARDCVEYRKHLLTASYLDSQIRSLNDEVTDRKLLFLCEMGLDPGIDHMSAMELIDRIKLGGGKVTSFMSHCGGLVAPESDNNPWHYKVSWNPRNIVLAGKAGAIYRLEKRDFTEKYEQLFDDSRSVPVVNQIEADYCYYPNRDSLPYLSLYKLHDADTFMRTTLRAKEFMTGWKQIIDLGLTDETARYESDGKSIAQLFKAHLSNEKFDITSATSAFKAQMEVLGLDDNTTKVNKGFCSPADILQVALERNLALQSGDKDMIVMLHQIEYMKGNEKHIVESSLVVKGDDSVHTAMAKTVGLPLGIAAKLILNGELKMKGVHVPVSKEVYEPVLAELEKHGISFMESDRQLTNPN